MTTWEAFCVITHLAGGIAVFGVVAVLSGAIACLMIDARVLPRWGWMAVLAIMAVVCGFAATRKAACERADMWGKPVTEAKP